MIEFARVLGNTSSDQPDSLTDFLRSLGNKGPKEAEIKALADQFKVLSDTARHILERQGLQKFPGEIGDWYVELTADFQLQFMLRIVCLCPVAWITKALMRFLIILARTRFERILFA